MLTDSSGGRCTGWLVMDSDDARDRGKSASRPGESMRMLSIPTATANANRHKSIAVSSRLTAYHPMAAARLAGEQAGSSR